MNKRIYKCLEDSGVDALITCRPDNVTYCTGYDTPLPYGSIDNFINAPFSYALVDSRIGKTTLVVPAWQYAAAKAQSFADEIMTYDFFDFFTDIDCPAEYDACLDKAVSALKGAKSIAVEERSLPASVYKKVLALDANLVDAAPVFNESRRIKQPYEIERLCYAAGIVTAGHRRFLEYSKNFNSETEMEIYTGVYRAMCETHGKPFNLVCEFSTGPQLCQLSGVQVASNRKIEVGDLGILDTSVRLNGYWCDCANTVVFGAKPNEEQAKYFDIVTEAYNAAFNKLYPGNTFRDADTAASDVFRKHGMEPIVYTGHQLGCNVNEPPRILCYSEGIIEPNMVVCIEPQNFTGPSGKTGVRLEHAVLITENGPESLTPYPWGHQI